MQIWKRQEAVKRNSGVGSGQYKGMGRSMDFYKRMKLVCQRIPKGSVATYGQIALLCGKPGNARQVGHGLKLGLAGKDISAHRVVNARGELSGAVYFDTPDLQKLLLQEEGVEAAWTGKGWKVDLKRYGWKNTLEEAKELEGMYAAQCI